MITEIGQQVGSLRETKRVTETCKNQIETNDNTETPPEINQVTETLQEINRITETHKIGQLVETRRENDHPAETNTPGTQRETDRVVETPSEITPGPQVERVADHNPLTGLTQPPEKLKRYLHIPTACCDPKCDAYL